MIYVHFTTNSRTINGNMLSSQIVYILNFFDAFGYCTESSAFIHHKRIKLFIVFGHIILAVLFTLYQFQLVFELNSLLGALKTSNEVVQYIFGLYTYWLIILDSFLNRQAHRCFWQTLQQSHTFLFSQFLDVHGYLWKLIEFFAITILLYLLNYWLGVILDNASIFVFLVLITICQIRVFYYLFALNILNAQLMVIEHEIIAIKNISHLRSDSKCSISYELKRFKWVAEYYQCVIEMTKFLNDIFGWSQIALVLFCFFTFMTNLNWWYSKFDELSIAQLISKYRSKID